MVRASAPPEPLLALVQDAAVITWSLDAAGGMLDSAQWSAFTGQTHAQVVGDGWLDVVHPDDRVRADAAWKAALARGGHFNADYRLGCPDGIYRWFNARATPVRGGDGAIERWIGVCLEVAGTWRYKERTTAAAWDTIGAPIVRAARAMLNWSASDLCERSGVSVSTIRRLENDNSEIQSRRTSTARLIQVFLDAGLRFLDRDGEVVGVGWANAT